MKGFSELTLSAGLVIFWLTAKVYSQPRQPQVPCFFIFGDSLVDNGNNNGILTLARANYRPYGIDFPLGPTGRFTNGRTYVDALGNIFSIVKKQRSMHLDFHVPLLSYNSVDE